MPCSSCNEHESGSSGRMNELGADAGCNNSTDTGATARTAGDTDSQIATRGTMRLALPPPSTEAVARFMGLPTENAGSAELSHTIRGAIALAEPLLKPVAVWGLFDLVSRQTDSITLAYPGKNQRYELPCSGRFFADATHVQLALITLGAQLEELLAKLYADDPLTAMACDAVGSATLAAAGADFASRRQRAMARAGLELAITYVPGCQALPLTAQKGIFELLQPERIGVQLSESCLMHPAKSATSVAPAAASLPAWMKKVSPCQLCNLRQTCNFKATKQQP